MSVFDIVVSYKHIQKIKERKMIILVDMDGVLAHFEKKFAQEWMKRFPNELRIPIQERRTFYIHEQYGPKYHDKVRSITSAPGFFLEMEPIPAAIEGFKRLQTLGHDVRICTAPLLGTPTCMQEKQDWVEKYLGRENVRKMIISSDKTVIRGDVLIDDRPTIEGIYPPVWEHIIFDWAYNRHITNRRRVQNWQEILNLFP